MTDSDSANLYFDGCNVHVRNGAGITDSINGLGNLIVGYNRDRAGRFEISDKTGSHNLIIGDDHNYSRFGGFVAGKKNAIEAEWASVSGGYLNTASGIYSSVSGGFAVTASGDGASVSGGYLNTASGIYSSVSGGHGGTASGNNASVSGGYWNTASGDYASVSGGRELLADFFYQWAP